MPDYTIDFNWKSVDDTDEDLEEFGQADDVEAS